MEGTTGVTDKPAEAEVQPQDDFSFFKAEALPEDQRESWTKGFEGIKSKFSEAQSEAKALKERVSILDNLSADPDFNDWLDLSPEEFRRAVSLLKAGKAPDAAAAQVQAKPAQPAAQNPNGMTEEEVSAWRDERKMIAAQQEIADLVNSYPEAKDLLKDDTVKKELIRLTGDHADQFGRFRQALSLEGAYAIVTRDRYADLKLKGLAGKAPAAAEAGTPNRKETPRKFGSTQEAVAAAFENWSPKGSEE